MASNSTDDQPHILTVGTEVSAKFKGAFCEAKIKRVDRSVKCKITYKNSNESVTLHEAQVLNAAGGPIGNDFKLGSAVYVNSHSSVEPRQATLTKIFDQSVYTVIFNDGDERSLKRSFIRFKGEKHFLDSETLNNAPLNNPEHFLFPIRNNEKAAGETEVLNRSKTRNQKKKLEDTESENLNSENNESENEAEEDENSDGESDKDSENSSDEYLPEEKDLFVAQLYKFMDDRGTPLNQVPSINKIDLDLHRFFMVVRKHGGFNRITKQRGWLDVYKRLSLPNPNASNVINLKCAYKRYLHPYEDLCRKLGSAVYLPSLRQASSASGVSRRLSSTDSHRQIFKQRFYGSANTSTTTSTPSTTKKTPVSARSRSQKSANDSVKDEPPSDNPNQLKPNASDNESDNEQNKELTLESLAAISTSNTINNTSAKEAHNLMLSTSIAMSNESNDEQSSQHQEEISLDSIFLNIKKEKKEKEMSGTIGAIIAGSAAKKTAEPNLSASKSSGKQGKDSAPLPASAKSSPLSTPVSQKRPLSATGSEGSSKSKNRRSSIEKVSSGPASSLISSAKKSKSDTNQLDSKNSDVYDGEDEEDEPKAKKKPNRLSVTGSEESNASSTPKAGNGARRKSSFSSKTNDDPDSSANENEELVPLTIRDLDVNRLLEVKYGNGKQIFNAKVIEIDTAKNKLLVHYPGWNARYDEWIELSRILKVHGEEFCGNKRRKGFKASRNSEAASQSSEPSDTMTNTKETDSNSNQKPTATKSFTASNLDTPSGSESSTATKGSKSVTSAAPTPSSTTLNASQGKSVAAKRPSFSSTSSSLFESPPRPINQSSSPNKKDQTAQKSKPSESSESLDHPASLSVSSSAGSLISKESIGIDLTDDKKSKSTEILTIQSIKKEIVDSTESASKPDQQQTVLSSSSSLISSIAQDLMGSPTENELLVIGEENATLAKQKENDADLLKLSSDKLKSSGLSRRSSETKLSQKVSGEDSSSSDNSTSESTAANSSAVKPPTKFNFSKNKDKLNAYAGKTNMVASGSSSNSSVVSTCQVEEKEAEKVEKANEETPTKLTIAFKGRKSRATEEIKVEITKTELLMNIKEKSKSEAKEEALMKKSDANEPIVLHKENDSVEKNGKNKENAKSAASVLNKDDSKENTQQTTSGSAAETIAKKTVDLSILASSTSTQNQNSVNTSLVIGDDVSKKSTAQLECKYPFHLNDCTLFGKQRIRFIEEQMRLCREEYAKLKNEVAEIDRKKKRLKRNLLEKSASMSNTNGNGGGTPTHSLNEESKQDVAAAISKKV